MVNQYHQLAFFWDKFGLTKQDIQNEPARWVLTMLKIGEAETQEHSAQLDILKQRRERKGR